PPPPSSTLFPYTTLFRSPPSYRFDLSIEEDFVEEVGRMIGYDRIPAVPGHSPAHLGSATELEVDHERLADVLVARGYHEVVTYRSEEHTSELQSRENLVC